jgi:hypothetical protein
MHKRCKKRSIISMSYLRQYGYDYDFYWLKEINMLFTLAKNQLYAKEGDARYAARARVTKRVAKEEVIEKIAYSCTLTDVDIGAALTALEKALVEYIALGCSVDLGFLGFCYSIRGGFDSESEGFHKDRNWVKVSTNVSRSFADAVNRAAKPEKIKAESKVPNPSDITKALGDMKSTDYKAGNMARLSGAKLLFDPVDAETGVFLQPASGSGVRVSEYGKTCDTSIVFKIPDGLTPGITDVEVRTRSTEGKIMTGNLVDPVLIAA